MVGKKRYRGARSQDDAGIESSSNNDWGNVEVSTLLFLEARHDSEHGGDAKLNGLREAELRDSVASGV
jgi:hypothetical protein